MSFFNPNKFNVRIQPPMLCGGVQVGGDDKLSRFIIEFGCSWKRTPVEGLFIVGSDRRPISFTYQDGEIASYGLTLCDLKERYISLDGFGDAIHYSADPVYKYSYLQILAIIAAEEQGVYTDNMLSEG